MFLRSFHSLVRGVHIQSCHARAKKFTNYVFCHPQGFETFFYADVILFGTFHSNEWEEREPPLLAALFHSKSLQNMMKRHLSWLWYNGIISNGTRLFIFCGTFMSWQNPVMDHKRIFNLYPFNFFFSCSFVQVLKGQVYVTFMYMVSSKVYFQNMIFFLPSSKFSKSCREI